MDFDRNGETIYIPADAKFIIHNGPKRKPRASFGNRTQRSIEHDFSMLTFTSYPNRATHVLVPSGVRSLGEKLQTRAPLLQNTKRIITMDELTEAVRNAGGAIAIPMASDSYPPSIETVGDASFLKTPKDVLDRTRYVKNQALFSKDDILLREKYHKLRDDLQDMTQWQLAIQPSGSFESQFRKLKEAAGKLLDTNPSNSSTAKPGFLKGWIPSLWKLWYMDTETKEEKAESVYPLCSDIRVIGNLLQQVDAAMTAIGIIGTPILNLKNQTFADTLTRALTYLKSMDVTASFRSMKDEEKIRSYYTPLSIVRDRLAGAFRNRLERHENAKAAWLKQINEPDACGKDVCVVQNFEDFLWGLFGCFGQIWTMSSSDEIIVSIVNGYKLVEPMNLLRRLYRVIDPESAIPLEATPPVMTWDLQNQLRSAILKAQLKTSGGWTAVLEEMQRLISEEKVATVMKNYQAKALKFENVIRKDLEPLTEQQRACIYLQVFLVQGLKMLGVKEDVSKRVLHVVPDADPTKNGSGWAWRIIETLVRF